MDTVGKRGKVWLAVAGLVKSPDGKWLVVKKKYGGLKGQWSLPAGFVEQGETADEAVVREVKEETGIGTSVIGMIGLRSGVINNEISDNMILFLLEPADINTLETQEKELFEARFIAPEVLYQDKEASVLLQELISRKGMTVKEGINGLNPGDQFGYTSYRLFL